MGIYTNCMCLSVRNIENENVTAVNYGFLALNLNWLGFMLHVSPKYVTVVQKDCRSQASSMMVFALKSGVGKYLKTVKNVPESS